MRVRCLVRYAEQRRFFVAFYLWPLLLFFFQNMVPGWQVRGHGYDFFVGLLWLGTVLDFLYYYGLKATTNRGWQLGSLILLLPCFLVAGRSLLPLERVSLVLPHHGKALIWTEGVWEASCYYFINTQLPAKGSQEQIDPNFGRPVFAPLTGSVLAIEGDQLIMGNDQVRVKLGPLLAGSLRVSVGAPVFANQPVGLLGQTTGTPGIRLEVLDGKHAVFSDVLTGRVLAQEKKRDVPHRNTYVASTATQRWRME